MLHHLIEPLVTLVIIIAIVAVASAVIVLFAKGKSRKQVEDVVSNLENVYRKTETLAESAGQKIADYESIKEEKAKKQQKKHRRKRKYRL